MPNWGRVSCGLVCGLLWAGVASSEQLVELYGQAVEQDPRYQAAIHLYDARQQERTIARAGLLPQLDVVYEDIDTTQNIVRTDNTVFGQGEAKFPTTNVLLNLRQPIFRYDRWQAFQQAKASVRQAESEFAAEQQDLIVRVAQLYLDVLAAHDALALANAELAAIRRNLDLVETRRASGLVGRMDLFDAEARLAVAEVQVVEAEDAVYDARQALAESVGELPGEIQALGEDVPLQMPEPADEQAWVDAALANNYRLAAAVHAVEVASREVRERKGGHWPTLDLVVGDSDRDTQGSLFGGGSQVQTQEIMLRFQLPLYSGGATRAGVRQAASLHLQTQAEARLLSRQTERETRSAFRGVLTGIQKIESLRRSLDAQTTAVNAKERGYSAGVNTLLDILDAQRDLYYIRREVASARYTYLLDMLRLKQASARLEPQDLVPIDRLLAPRSTDR